MNRFYVYSLTCLLTAMGPLSLTAASGGDTHHAIAPDLKLFFAAINFIILVSILVHFTKKPVQAYYQKRNAQLRRDIEIAQAKYQEATQQMQEIDAKLAAVDSEINAIRQDLINSGERIKNKVMDDAKRLADEIGIESDRLIQNKLRFYEKELKERLLTQAIAQATQQLKDSITPDVAEQWTRRQIDRFKPIS